MAKHLSARAKYRLEVAGALLCADQSAGGLDLRIQPAPGQTLHQAVQAALPDLPAEVVAYFQGLVDWVEDFDGRPCGVPAPKLKGPLEHLVLQSKPSVALIDHSAGFEVESDGEYAALQAMASIEKWA